MAIQPVAFLSYARKDGEEFARKLRERLAREQPEITLWRDRDKMEGGVDWWLQIREALENVRFLVLVITPAAIESEVVRREWRYAREHGVCVYPVKGAPDAQLNYAALPRWMSAAHFFDLEKEWETFVNYMKSPPNVVRVPFMADDLPEDFVQRAGPFGLVASRLLDEKRENPRPIVLALHGAGGFGKTTIAKAVCHSDDVMTAFDGGILWATLGEKPSLKAELTKLYAALTGQRPDFVDTEDAAYALSQKLADRRCLIVVDDVWNSADLRPFLRGGKNCARLVTTRQQDVAVDAVERVSVEEMELQEAVHLLSSRLDAPDGTIPMFQATARRLGEWPLLLELANGALRVLFQQGYTIAGALDYLSRGLAKRGITWFDRGDAKERNQAIGKTMAVSLEMLAAGERDRYFELGAFPEDAEVPLSTVRVIWNMDEFDAEDQLQRLARFSLVHFNAIKKSMRLHDAIRAYLAEHLQDAMLLHARLADAWPEFSRLPDDYARTHIVYHIAEAMRAAQADALHRRVAQLSQLIQDSGFKQHQIHHGHPVALRRNIAETLERGAGDTHEQAPPLLVAIALGLTGLPAELFRPEVLFQLAAEGELQAAVERLVLLKPDREWRDIVLLTLAWLAEGRRPEEAAAVRARIEKRDQEGGVPAYVKGAQPDGRIAGDSDVVGQLLARMRGAPPSVELPPAPDLFTTNSILSRIGGGNETGIEPLNINAEALQTDRAPAYLAEQDGPLLVAFAKQDPLNHTRYLKQYIAIHASNSYVFYRNRSLWDVAKWVLQFPDSGWVRDLLKDLATAVLGESRIDFSEFVPLTLHALAARAGDAAAASALDSYRQKVQDAARGIDPGRGKGDPWGFHLRRLTALAEVYSIALERHAEATELLEQALGLPYGFAGFRARACLTLADAVRICRPQDSQSIDRAMRGALSAAHNIQDYCFCARTTAQVNAMAKRWRPGFDPQQVIRELTQNPASPQFCGLHTVGEAYELRIEWNKIPIPPEALVANTFPDLAEIYGLDPKELEEVNAGAIAAEKEVNIPSPEFTPLLAARFGAEALASPAVPSSARVALIQKLVPLAVGDRTALDTVSGRLLLAAAAAGTQLQFPNSLLELKTNLGRWDDQAIAATEAVRASVV
jgi:hypothetical protein